MIKITIIIPAYNAEKYIEKCLRSVINQTMSEIEIIIINDGSTDKTKEVIEKVSKEDSRIKLINKINGGVSSCRNLGISLAKGEYLYQLDSDDYIDINLCQDTYNYAKSRELDIVIFDFYWQLLNGEKRVGKGLESNKNILNGEEWTEYFLKGESFPSTWNKLIKTSLIKKFQYPKDISFGEDLLTNPQILFYANKIGYIDEPYYNYVQNENSITNQNQGLRFYQIFEVLEKLDEFYKKNYKKFSFKIFEEYKLKHLINFIYYKPYEKNKLYEIALEKFLEQIKTLKFGFNSLKLNQRIILWYIKEKCDKKKLLKLIKFIQKIKKIKRYI